MTQRTMNTTSVGDLSFQVYEPTEGQIAVLAQHLRLAQRRTSDAGAGIAAMATFMTVLDKLIVDDEVRDELHDLLVGAEISFKDVADAILNISATTDGEVVDATPQTITKPRRRIAR